MPIFKQGSLDLLQRKHEEALQKNKSYNLAQMDPSMIKDPALTLQLALKQKSFQLQQQYHNT